MKWLRGNRIKERDEMKIVDECNRPLSRQPGVQLQVTLAESLAFRQHEGKMNKTLSDNFGRDKNNVNAPALEVRLHYVQVAGLYLQASGCMLVFMTPPTS
eukprot:1149979-Pelagomonas_calceolata.AAC.2